MKKRIILALEYDGSAYHGWQKQPGLISLQEKLEQALSYVADEPIEVICAGRTDKGVHAIGQIVHFDTNANRLGQAWVQGSNAYLKQHMSVVWQTQTDDSFHARFSALSRRYYYVLYNHPLKPTHLRANVSWFAYPLNVMKMRFAAKFLLGTHDFSSFRGSNCQAKSPIRTLMHLDIHESGPFIVIDVKANAFLHHMVRNLVGVLCEVGRGRQSAEWVEEVLRAKDRTKASVTASPNGLYLSQVEYPIHYHIPLNFRQPWFLGKT